MNQFSKSIAVGTEQRIFQFTRIQNTNGVKFFITSQDLAKKPISCSLRQNEHGSNWKLVPGSLRWLYDIEQELSDAIIETAVS
jgi:hypothetical protein